jgi:hypothetical protein
MISRDPTDFSVRLIFVSRWRADWRLGFGFPVNADAAGSGLSGKVPGRKSGFAGGAVRIAMAGFVRFCLRDRLRPFQASS